MRKLLLILLTIAFISAQGQTPLSKLIRKKVVISNGYAYRRSVTIDNTKVPNTDQTDFPVLFRNNSGTVNTLATAVTWVSGDQFTSAMAGQSIRINGTIYTIASFSSATALVLTGSAGTQSAVAYNDLPQFATVANGGLVQNSSGYDIIVTSDAAGTSVLNFQLSQYVATTGSIILWIKIPTLHTASADVFYIFYGNASISTFQGNTTGTWNANYKLALHLGDGTTLSATDATSNANNGTITAATATAGKINGGASFAGAAYVSFDVTKGVTKNASALTYSGWFKATNFTTDYQTIYEEARNSSANDRLAIGLRSSGKPYVGGRCPDTQGFQEWRSNTALSTATWYYFVVTVSSGTVAMYINGSAVTFEASGTFTNSSFDNTNPNNIAFGADYTSTTSALNFNGVIDEFRTSNVARSADFVMSSYNNQNSPQTFYSVGNQTAN